MIAPSVIFDKLKEAGVEYYTGVPDSLLKSFCAYISDNTSATNHVVAANEGAAVGLAIGYHLATSKVPLVYLQNSGLGNAVNPLMSLVDKEIYSIPIIFFVGWRGAPGVEDEPQHVKQGRVMLRTLDAMEIPFGVLESGEIQAGEMIETAVQTALQNSSAFAVIVKKGIFDSYSLQTSTNSQFPFSREDVIKAIVDQLDADDIVVSTTGMASRELFEYRVACGHGHDQDLLTVGGMGHASQIALGIAAQKTDRRVVCIDGDGATANAYGVNGDLRYEPVVEFYHIIINNGAHDSVGGQPTVGFDLNLQGIAHSCGYSYTDSAQK